MPAVSGSAVATSVAHPPETLEGWYVLHQIFSRLPGERAARVGSTQLALPTATEGWSAAVELIGSKSDLLVMHFRPTLDAIGEAQRALAADPAIAALRLDYSFLSVTEAGLYHITAQLAKAAAARGGAVGDGQYVAELAERAAAERNSPHVRRRLYPSIPDGMPYVCFYPMSKRRNTGQNWYTLSLDERSRLMYTHGMTGRRYAGKVVQVISGAIGLDAWEWGVTLFAADPLEFKRLVTDMRFDEVSAEYAEFGDFYVGKLAG
jgi:chlorite dismutase